MGLPPQSGNTSGDYPAEEVPVTWRFGWWAA